MDWYGQRVAERRIAEAFGYEYEFLERRPEAQRAEVNGEQTVMDRIRGEIDAGRPVIALGIAGPEECLVAGYRDGGRTLLVQSFFQQSEDYLEVEDWTQAPMFRGLHLYRKRRPHRSRRENLVAALTWAVEMGSMAEAGGRAAGLAAYDAWAHDMLRDQDFAGLDLDTLQYNCMSISDNGIILLMARRAAADYLEMMQGEVGETAREHLLAAAGHHRRESAAIEAAHDVVPWGNVQGEELLRRLERANRERLAQVILECKGCFARAMDETEAALRVEGA
jgi:hypothetical protein